MYEISKRFTFSASHVLEGLPEGHQCGRLHGHNYIFEVVLASETLNEHGFVQDYGDLRFIKEYVDAVLDHRHLNDVLEFQPTAECMARHMLNWVRQHTPYVVAFRVSETPNTWAEYRINK